MFLKCLQRSQRKGSSIVELAAVSPVMFLLLWSIFEYGRFIMIRQLVETAAREGARQAAANSPFKVLDATADTYTPQTLATSDIQATVMGYLTGHGLLNSSGAALASTDISVYRADPATGNAMTDSKGSAWTAASFGEPIAVKMSVKYKPMFPAYGYLLNPAPFTFICIMRSEASQ